ncbi:acyl-CoA carboxylase subunit epsilon [Streptomyces sp. NPDC001401]|uniref:acyl-CoA carboxylase subunit epsilon n=1 Tax=Streptomyces sp. NPDC001401 TaxID=3364570 RepID=UPI0036A358C3
MTAAEPTAAPTTEHLSAAGLRIVRGNPDPHELAALTAVLFGLGRRGTSSPAPAGPAPSGGWRRRRGAGHPGATSWRR